MAKVEIKNIIKGHVSPNNDISPEMDDKDAFKLMVSIASNLQRCGWWIHDIFDNEQYKGFVLKKNDERDGELAVSIHLKKY